MLTSITPLGERGRGNRWWVTTAALVLGCALAGAGVGAIAGAFGAVILSGVSVAWRLGLVGAALAVGVLLELDRRRRMLPTVRRQVNEDWLRAYRGWVYGLGFGIQLGTGVATVVTTSAVYATFIAAFASASIGAGALIGGVFGLVRGGSLLVAWRVRTPAQLAELGRSLGRSEAPVRRVALLGQSVLAVLAAVAAWAI
jgi:hypothetical protein